ncbi:mammaglobin-A-like [Saccopteryx bilineata]|uniref:mammaglobin-A-like n=1 Tax=Saccopteryx bilineata TaxID=59482 RepID=UPI00338DF3CB
MKLLPVLVLAALPFYCYAGSGCTLMTQVINQAIDPEVSADQYIENFREFIMNREAEKALRQAKQCFLQQSKETLTNYQVLEDAIYNSVWCKPF